MNCLLGLFRYDTDMNPGCSIRILCALAGIAMSLIHMPRASGQAAREFEVASIKPNRGAGDTSGENTARGKLTVKNDSLKELVKLAFDVKDFQIAGGPRWLDTERYDIVAKANTSGDISDGDLRPLLQALLRDRFKLEVHRETRELSAYSLVIAKKGSRLVEHTGTNESSSSTSSGSLRATKASTGRLAGTLSRILSRPVIDNTGLKGEYDYKLEWAPTEQTDSPLPSIFTALQEQLGLKLDSARTPVDVLVIDSAEKPLEN
jgi:uncharacterized protein (TIGR03435 family)